MKKLEELLNKRDSELKSESIKKEAAKKARKEEFHMKLWNFSLGGGGIGFAISLIIGFYKGCGLFHYDTNHPGKAYIFDTKDAGEGFWIFPLVGVIIGLLYAIISSNIKDE